MSIAIDPDKSPIFVIGTSRSGTTLLRMMLCAHPRIYLTHEASFYLWETAFPWKKRSPEDYLRYFLQTFSFKWLRLDPRPILEKLPKPIEPKQVPQLYTEIMKAKAAEYGKVRFGDKTPSHSGKLAQIFRDYPEAKVVRIVRDPRGVVKSLSRMPWASRSIIAGSMHCEIERKQATRFREQIFELRLEDLLADTRTVMGEVLDFVGEPWSDNVLDHCAHLPSTNDLPPVPWFALAAKKRSKPSAQWSEYGPKEIRLIERLNRKGLEDMGYARLQMQKEPSRLSVLVRWLTDLPEFFRFAFYFIRLAWASRNPGENPNPWSGSTFKRLNPAAWKLYPGFEMPETPRLPEGWDA